MPRTDLKLYRANFRDRRGQRKTSKRWTGGYVDLRGRRRKLTLATSKGDSYAAFAKFVDATDLARCGRTVNSEDLPPLVRSRFYEDLKAAGHRAAEAANPRTTWQQYMPAFEAALRANQCVALYVKNTVRYVRSIGNACGFRTAQDFDNADAIKAYLAGLCDNGLGLKTANHYIQGARRFTLWLFKQKRVLSTHPLADLQPFNAGEDQRRRRRALLAAELVRLLTTTEAGPRRSGFTGRERALIYRLALESGLRRNELRTLRWSNVDLVAGLITIDARNSKHREEDELPLRRRTAAILAAWREHCGASDTSHVFTQDARWCDTHLFIRRDLEAASVPFETPDGRIDFHSLRVSFITALARGGVHPRKAMQLARHSSIDLTMRVYTKLQTTELASCLDVLPDTPDSAAAAKAG